MLKTCFEWRQVLSPNLNSLQKLFGVKPCDYSICQLPIPTPNPATATFNFGESRKNEAGSNSTLKFTHWSTNGAHAHNNAAVPIPSTVEKFESPGEGDDHRESASYSSSCRSCFPKTVVVLLTCYLVDFRRTLRYTTTKLRRNI